MSDESPPGSRTSRWVAFVLTGVALTVLLVVGGVVGKRWLTRTARARANEVLKRAAAYADVDYDDVDVELIPPAAHIRALTIRPVASGFTLRVGDVAVRRFTEGALAPLVMDVSLRGVTAELPPRAPTMPWALSSVFDGPLVGDVAIAYRYQTATNEVDLGHLEVALRDLGSLTLAANVAGVSFEVPQVLPGIDVTKLDDPAAAAAMLASLAAPVLRTLHETALARAEVRYEDHGLLPRMVMAAALQSQQTAIAAARRLSDAVEDSLDNAPGIDAATRAELRQFLARPGT